jgi:hypothetical protein
MKNEKELQVNEEPILIPGMVENSTIEVVTPDPDRVQQILDQSEESNEEPLPLTGIKFD